MLTALQVQNFKGIAAKQRIDFAPLTLLFGPNSAGKSTILQAVVYLHELLEHGGADVDRTDLGGDVIELGGFARLVHRHETDRAMVLRAEFTTPGGLERFGRDLTDFRFPDLDDEVESAWLELTIRDTTTPAFAGPLIKKAVIGVGQSSDPLIELRAGDALSEGEALTVGVNLAHPLIASELEATDADGRPFASRARAAIDEWEQICFSKDALQLIDKARAAQGDGAASLSSSLTGWTTDVGRSWMVFGLSRSRFSALPSIGEPLRIVTFNEPEAVEHDARFKERTIRRGYEEALEAELSELRARERAADELRTFLEMVIIGTTSQLAESLSDALYIGPLRAVPPRGFLYERGGRTTSWANGLAAWDRLLADRASLVEDTNVWIDGGLIDARCRVVVHELVNWSAAQESKGYVEERVRRLMLDTGSGAYVLPSEVGAGISQLIPVVVAAVEQRPGLLMIEQPEIHVHPALQVGLADLFIDAVTRERARRTMIVETHSEHLMLRLLRRIEETHRSGADSADILVTPKDVSVVFVEQVSGEVKVTPLRIDETGEFIDQWPRGFFEERANELF